jgi:hypothetical protein
VKVFGRVEYVESVIEIVKWSKGTINEDEVNKE